MNKNHYEILRVRRTATDAQIRAQYAQCINDLRSAMALGVRSDPARLDELRAAFKILSDPAQRAEYDRCLAVAVPANESIPNQQPIPATAQGDGLLKRLRDGRIKAWKVFFFAFLLPGLIVELLRAALIGDFVKLLKFVVSAPLAFVYVVALAPGIVWIIGCYLLWRSSLNQRFRWLGYVTRAASVTFTLFMVIATAGVAFTYHALILAGGKLAGAPLSATRSLPGGLLARACETEIGKAETPGAKLLATARCGDLKQVQQLLDSGVDVNTRETNKQNLDRTPLHYAAGGSSYNADGKHIEVAKLLIARGADVNTAAQGGYTPLHVAAGLGQLPMVDLLLQKGANPNAIDSRATPLHAAVNQGHKEIVALLIRSGANVNLASPQGRTPLSEMGMLGSWYPTHDEIMKMLIKSGANINGEPKGSKPLLVAINRKRPELVMFLVENGAVVDDFAIQQLGSMGQKEVVESLVAKKLVMFDRPDPGAVLLHGAACIAAEEFFDWVLNQTRNPNQPDAQGSTPLHFAVGCANVVHVDKLLARGANVNAKDAKGQSPITRLYQRSLPIATSLLKAGANPSDSRDNGDITVLMSVVYTDDFATTKLLVDHGANVNAKNSLGATAMHEAARLGRDNAAKALVTAKGIKLDELNNAGLTALHIAAEQGAPEIVRILLQNGANRSVRTPSGKTALELAEAGGPGYAPTAALLRDGAK